MHLFRNPLERDKAELQLREGMLKGSYLPVGLYLIVDRLDSIARELKTLNKAMTEELEAAS